MAQDDPVKTAGTTMRIVRIINKLDGARVGTIADEVSLPKSTVHNYLKTLEQNEYLVNNDGIYRVGLRFLELGERARSRIDVYDVAKPELKELATTTGELVNLVVEEHGRGVYIYRAKGNQDAQYHTYVGSHVGERMYLHSTAPGKVILAHMDESEIESIVDRHGLPALTEQTIQDRDSLFQELADIEKSGVAFDYEEQISGLWSLGAPVINGDELLGAISISGPASQLTAERFEDELPELLQETANVISINIMFS
jgi:DNA-binding IclR family transcriptional regulator